MSAQPECSHIAPDVKLGKDVQIYGFVNLYGCTIGDGTRACAFVEIKGGALIGQRLFRRHCPSQPRVQLCLPSELLLKR